MLSKEIVFEEPELSVSTSLRIDLARAIELGLALDPETPECNDLLENMDATISAALDQLKLGSRLRRTYAKEFNRAEFGVTERSHFGWIYAAMQSMDIANVEMCFGENGVKFMETCELTNWRRQLRRESFLRARKANMALVSKVPSEGVTEAVRPPVESNMPSFPRQIVPAGNRLTLMKRIAKSSYEPQVIGHTIDFCCALLKEAA